MKKKVMMGALLLGLLMTGCSEKQEESNAENKPVQEKPDKETELSEKGTELADNVQRVHLKYTTGQVADVFPEEIKTAERVTLYLEGQEETVLSAEQMDQVLTNLAWIDFSKAKLEDQTAVEADTELRLYYKNATYAIPYHLVTNSFDLGGGHYYADDETVLVMHSVLAPKHVLGQLGEAQLQGEKQFAGEVEPIDASYELDRLYVDGVDFDSWKKKLQELKSFDFSYPYYSSMLNESDQLGHIRQYENSIIVRPLEITFTTDQHETPDGIKVGLTSTEVLKKLGQPNRVEKNSWYYRAGDYTRFKIIFEADKVKFISMLMPL